MDKKRKFLKSIPPLGNMDNFDVNSHLSTIKEYYPDDSKDERRNISKVELDYRQKKISKQDRDRKISTQFSLFFKKLKNL